MSEIVGWATEGKDTGQWSSQTYHSKKDCNALKQANPDNLGPVTETDRDRYNMRECTLCQRAQTAERLKQLGVDG